MFDFIVHQFGMFHTLPPECSAVKQATKIARLVEKQPHRSPHVWSQHTFGFLNSWWECAQKSCGSVSSILNESPHSSRLIGLGARNVKSLAEQLGFSRSHLSRKLKWQWDRPPGAVLRKLRIDEAAKLLRTSNLNIGLIAVKLGFSAPSAFTRAFKKAYGTGPLAYRAAHGSGLGGKKRSAALS
jgi:AraC-like DNA-binding protein